MQAGVIKALLLISCIFLLLMIASFFSLGKKWYQGKSIKKILFVSLFLLCAIWSLRYSVGYYSHYNPNDEVPAMTLNEEIFNSLVHTLQSFSMDEGYTEYVVAGKDMMAAITHEGSVWITIYGVYASMLNVFAVIAGGAILFDLLSEFFPKLRLILARASFWKKKYYFSELNDKSLALAKSIQENDNHHPILIFADAYVDDEEENSSERMLSAQSMGAICLKDDLMHVGLRQLGQKEIRIFLIDENENSNIETLSTLLESNDPLIDSSEIYVFSSDDHYSQLDEEITFIISQFKGKREKMPVIIPVNGVRNMSINLLKDLPLFEPLIGRKDKKDLRVTILGSGVIGTEFFLNTYWFGQLLEHDLNVTVVSKEKKNSESEYSGEGNFEGRINNVNPDILKSQKGVFDEQEGAKAYLTYHYVECDVLTDDFETIFSQRQDGTPSGCLLDTDYFIVALGSDEDNFAVATKLKRAVGIYHAKEQKDHKTIISYVVYNGELCNALNGLTGDPFNCWVRRDSRNLCKYTYTMDGAAQKEADVYMHAFGSLDEVYGVKNVFFEDVRGNAQKASEVYAKQQMMDDAAQIRKTSKKRMDDIYKYEANLGKVLQCKYRIFAAGCRERSIFQYEKSLDDITKEIEAKKEEAQETKAKKTEVQEAAVSVNTWVPEYEMEQADAVRKYLKFIYVEKKNEQSMKVIHGLSLMEHRRWTAFMRIKGFRDPKELLGEDCMDKYLRLETREHANDGGAYKFLALKLHNCMVESYLPIRAAMDDYGTIIVESELEEPKKWKDYKLDPLDLVSLERWDKDQNREDYKRWDYPAFEFEFSDLKEYADKDEDIEEYCEKISNSPISSWGNVLQFLYRFGEKDQTKYYITKKFYEDYVFGKRRKELDDKVSNRLKDKFKAFEEEKSKAQKSEDYKINPKVKEEYEHEVKEAIYANVKKLISERMNAMLKSQNRDVRKLSKHDGSVAFEVTDSVNNPYDSTAPFNANELFMDQAGNDEFSKKIDEFLKKAEETIKL